MGTRKVYNMFTPSLGGGGAPKAKLGKEEGLYLVFGNQASSSALAEMQVASGKMKIA